MLRSLLQSSRFASRITLQHGFRAPQNRFYAISMELIKQLRQQTGAPLMQVKKALEAEGGDLEKAVQWLRKKGIDTAAKKSGRTAAEGLVALAVHANGKKAAIVEINSETDFVSRNEKFQELAQQIANLALDSNADVTVDTLKTSVLPSSGRTVAESVSELVGSIGENLQLRRVTTIDSDDNTVIASYVHNKIAADIPQDVTNRVAIGTIGSLVALRSAAADRERVTQLANQLAMHVAAMSPQYATRDEVSQEVIEHERTVLRDAAQQEGKKPPHLDKIVEGRLGKFFEEIVLIDQKWIHDDKRTVSKVLQEANAELAGFRRFKVGEGIEKEQVDFAAEVAAQAKASQ